MDSSQGTGLTGWTGGWVHGEARSPFTLNQRRARMPGDGQHILMSPMSSLPIHLSRLAPVPPSLSSVSGPHLAHLQTGWVLGNDHYRTRFINFDLNLFHVHKRKNPLRTFISSGELPTAAPLSRLANLSKVRASLEVNTRGFIQDLRVRPKDQRNNDRGPTPFAKAALLLCRSSFVRRLRPPSSTFFSSAKLTWSCPHVA